MSGKQTTLDLNGPILSFIQQPDAVVTGLSTATFVGVATATFPTQTPANPASSTGTLSYQWYAEGVGALSNGSFRGATISGTATTTLTLSNLKSPETNNINFFLAADYTPSAYGLIGVAVTVGSARSTGNAVNEPLSSNTAKLTVLPVITITSQPGIATVGAGSRAIFNVNADISDIGFGDLSYQWNINGQDLTDDGDTIIGATQSTLFFVPTVVGVSTVKVTVSNPNAVSVVSNIVDLFILTPRNIIIFEGFDSQNNYSKKEVNLGFVNDFTLVDDTFGSNFNTITFHASENNIDADLEIRASKGSDVGSYSGGQGGFSRVRITLEKNIEHTVLGISNNSGLFIYRKSSLIAVVGKGGNAGSSGNGGGGGGINVSGESGSGRNNGSGGTLVTVGTLPSNGILGSLSALIPISPDTKATGQTGGRTIPCSKGNYWLSKGKSPCEDIGLTQFYNTNGALISQSFLINRGFKPGYTITSTEGAETSNGGNGGGGATGGNGGNEGGGGGGSGYTDGSYTLTSTLSGGNTSSKSTINFRIYVPPAPVYVPPPYNPGGGGGGDGGNYNPTRITAQSTYGTGFVGIDRYANGTEGFAAGVAGGGTQGFIDTVNTAALATLPGNAQTNQQTANFLITYYQQTFNRLPDAGGFDYWLSNAAAGAYGNSTNGLVAAIVAATPTEAAVVQNNGGRTGVYARWTDGTTDADRGLNPSLGGSTKKF